MRREEAKSCKSTIEMLQRLAYNIHGVMDVIDADNCKKIIKALEQEPCEDAVSREDALMCMTGEYIADMTCTPEDIISKHIQRLRSLPPVKPKETGWIPVSERLPENDTSVLVTFANGMVSISSWHEATQYNNGFDNIGHGITEEGAILNYGVVAWMPLPTPYEPQESEDKKNE